MGLIGILLGLALLIGLAYRGWSVLLLTPAAALIAAAAGEPLLAHWTQTFMPAAAGFLAQFFPLFLLGALFGKLMDDGGSVQAIAGFMSERLGARRAILAVVLAGAMVTYGGVSLFVAFFVLVPMAQALFRAADIPRRLMPAAIALGTFTFTMSALPGTPAVQNAIPMPFFGTTPFAAPGLGIIASRSCWVSVSGGSDGVRPPPGGPGSAMAASRSDAGRGGRDLLVRERATVGGVRPARDPSGPGQRHAAAGGGGDAAAGGRRGGEPHHDPADPAADGPGVPGGGPLGPHLGVGGERGLVGDRRLLVAILVLWPSTGGGCPGCATAWMRASMPRSAGGQRGQPGGLRLGRRRHAGLRAGARLGARDRGRTTGLAGVSTNVLAALTGSASGGPPSRSRPSARPTCNWREARHRSRPDAPGRSDRRGHPRQPAPQRRRGDPARRVRTTHKESYLDLVMVAMVGAIIALAAVIVLGPCSVLLSIRTAVPGSDVKRLVIPRHRSILRDSMQMDHATSNSPSVPLGILLGLGLALIGAPLGAAPGEAADPAMTPSASPAVRRSAPIGSGSPVTIA